MYILKDEIFFRWTGEEICCVYTTMIFSIKLIALPLGRNSTHTIQNNKMNHLKCGKTLFLTGRIVFDKPNFVYIEEK